MIYCVWYPSGGFGTFVNAVLSLYGKGFARPRQHAINFSNTGDSHSLDRVAPTYRLDQNYYNFEFNPAINYSVLIDNGITSESMRFKKFFHQPTIIKLCYSDTTWPIVARTVIEKAMKVPLESELPLGDCWPEISDWAKREKFTLYLKDHEHRWRWRNVFDETAIRLTIDNFLSYDNMRSSIESLGIELEDFSQTWHNWRIANKKYIDPIEFAQSIIHDVKFHNERNLAHVTDLWTQSVINYFIALNFDFDVTYADSHNWFTNTLDIVKMLNSNGVVIDPH